MKKSLLVKLSVLLVVIVLSYCVFWFFKAGQSEKIISKFFSEASEFATMEEIKVSGFPTKQKFSIKNVKINLSSALFKNNKIVIPELEVEAGIFSNQYVIIPIGQAKLEDADLAKAHDIKFTAEPKIEMTIEKGVIANLSYSGSGFKIADESGANIFSASNFNFTIASSVDESGKLNIAVNGALDDAQTFGVSDIYKNLFEKRIVDNLKNDAIKVELPIAFDSAGTRKMFIERHIQKRQEMQRSMSGSAVDQNIQQQPSAPASIQNPSQPVIPDPKIDPAKNQIPAVPVQPSSPSSAMNLSQELQAKPPVPYQADNNLALLAANIGQDLKTKITFDLVINISGNEAAPLAINQPQEITLHGQHNIKINNILISNPEFEIAANGSLTLDPDDATPFGGLTIKVNNLQNVLNNFEGSFGQLIVGAEKYTDIIKPKIEFSDPSKLPTNASEPAIPSQNDQKPKPPLGQNAQIVPVPSDSQSIQDASQQPSYNMGDYYTQFFIQFSDRYRNVIQDIAMKNSVSKDNVAQFDIRREKNLQFLVNDTPVSEVMGRL